MIATLALVVAMALSPIGIAASHGPGTFGASLSDGAGIGHDHQWDEAGAAHHDATDHEHQTAAIAPPSGSIICDACTVALYGEVPLSVGHNRDGPRRPPRGDVI